MNSKLLRATMVIHGDTYEALANAIGISKNSFNAKINEKGTEFRQGEIAIIRARYKLTPEQLDAIFFTEEVS